ncbi:MAG: phosphate acyltransferase PlsX [Candidatus Sumerlaeia bacterium]|nr:phosphate acyltransferase PlsX [Candidatus Sumerlaeia bacterium]
MKIAVDAMGGDLGPRPAVQGAVMAARKFDVEVFVVGRERHLRRLLSALRVDDPRIHVVDAPEVVTMLDNPSESLRKRRSSLAVAAELVKNGEADALVSAGNTGAVVARVLMSWRTIPPIKKPAIATLLPSIDGRVVVIDSGAVVDAKPHQLVNFAAMGACYAQEVLHRRNPRIGVVSIGEEETKGNEQSLATAALLRQTRLNFLGNAEGRDAFTGDFDVLVCDGFVGNVMLKTAEGTAKLVMQSLKREAEKSLRATIAGWLLKPAIMSIKRRTDHEHLGGAPLLGVNGVCIIAHGSAGEKAYMNAIRVAAEGVSADLVNKQRQWLDATLKDLTRATTAAEPAPSPEPEPTAAGA